MIFEHTNYRDFLKGVLAERCRTNPRYSLRSFARQLGIQPSLLSEVLSSKRKLTEETAMKLGDRMDLSQQEQDYLRLLVQLDRARTLELKEATLRKLQQAHPQQGQVQDLSVDHFRVISEWYHFALLRLLEVEEFAFTAKAGAKALGIHEYEVEQAIQRMERLELIRLDESGRPRRVSDHFLVKAGLPNDGLRKYHTQMLQRTIDALSTQSPRERYTGTENVVIDADQMGEASKIFEDCFLRVQDLSRRRKGRSSNVYHLGIHFIRLTQIQNVSSKERKK